jgi:hypothetical protein
MRVPSALVAAALLPAWLVTAGWARIALANARAEGPAIRGVVVDAEGRGVEGASVYVEADPTRPDDVVAARTDPAGTFEISRATARRVLLRVEHPAFAPAVEPELVVEPGGAREVVRITLLRGTRIEGVVRHRDGRPFTAGRVVVQASAAAAAYAPPVPIAPDEDGGFAADQVPPGTARVHVLAFTPGRGPRRAAASATLSPIGSTAVQLRDGETAMVGIGLRDVVVSGRVTRGGQGVGVARSSTLCRPTAISASVTTVNAIGSIGVTPNKNVCSRCVIPTAPARPSITPAATTRSARARTRRRTARLPARAPLSDRFRGVAA